MSTTKQGSSSLASALHGKTIKDETVLMPFHPTTLMLVYGDMEYIRSVFGPTEVTRQMISDYYDNAKMSWTECEIPTERQRASATNWCRVANIRPLHYYAPMGYKSIYFRDNVDAFAFKLKFGIN